MSTTVPAGRSDAGPHDSWRRPGWLDTRAYPFTPRAFDTVDGRMSYVDEGSGPPVVLVHGTPTWSFLWRHAITHLAARGYRVVAPDHLGFGLSEKPADADYGPEAHARRLRRLLDELGLRDATLVLHDYGGPIGLPFALDRRDRVRALVLLNTWAWPLSPDARIARGARLAGGPLGGILYRWFNASPRLLLPSVFAQRERLTPEVHAQYLGPFALREARHAPWALARALLGAETWYEMLWSRRDELAELSTMLVWGMHDPTFGVDYLGRWREALPRAEVLEVPDAGHLVQEEAPEALAAALLRVLGKEGRASRL